MIRGEEIYGQFQTNDPGWKRLITEGLGELTDRLQSMGLRPSLYLAAEPPDSGEKMILNEMEQKSPYWVSVLV